MSCEFTEEVSLLVDGELPDDEAARMREHVEGCAACEQARESFLLLRQELRSYERTPDPRAQSKALASILDSRTSETAPGLWERLAEALSVRRLRPSHVATLAMLLLATALGLRWLAGSNNSVDTRSPEAPALANANVEPPPAQVAKEDREKKSTDSPDAKAPDAVNSQPIRQDKPQPHTQFAGAKSKPRVGTESARATRDNRGTNRRRREDFTVQPSRETAGVISTAPQPPSPHPSPTNVAARYADAGMRAAAEDPALRIGRHAERVERLLRSFRNASLTDDDPTLDVADARRLSKRLLFINIALRREAATAGDLPVEGLLDSVEPILIDIANLPDGPSKDAVGSIKERISKRQLVGVLQTRGMLASR